MKIVLLSGGSGKRLWPLSNDSRSKQFLKVLRNSEGQFESMVQRVWGQIDSAG
ncbi:sugar phosphate nucleotidyltransferase, partial [Paenibacillus sp. MCAF20]